MSIKFFIDRWLSGRPGRSLSSLSRVTSVPLSTIRRVYGEEGGNPDSKNMLPILAAVCSLEEMNEFVGKHYPELARFYQMLGRENARTVNTPDIMNEETLRQRESYFILGLAYAGLATVSHIERLFGQFGMQAAEELERREIIQRRGDEFVPVDGQAFAYGNNFAMNRLTVEHIVSVLKPNCRDFASAMVVSLDDGCLAEMEALNKEYLERAIAISQKSQQDKHAVALGLAYTRLLEGQP